MSRAFVKETDGPELVVRPDPVLPEGGPNHVTPWGALAFRERLARAVTERAAVEEGGIGDARGAELDGEIRWLERRITTFLETAPAPDPERVGFGTVVTLDGARGMRSVAIVGVDEVDPGQGLVSWVSPLARALHGAAVGDTVTVRTPGGDEEWEVTAIRSGP